MDRTPDFIQKKGTFDCDIVEANPIVWQDRLLVGEFIRLGRDRAGSTDMRYPSKTYYANEINDSYFRFYEPATGKYFGPIAPGLQMHGAIADGGRIVVVCVEYWGGSKFYQTESTDLINWSEPRVIIDDPDMCGYNCSLCKAGDRFVLALETGAIDEQGELYTDVIFAESKDMNEWICIPGARGDNPPPCLRYHNGYFYAFYLLGNYQTGFETSVMRSKDLKEWIVSNKIVIGYGEKDYELAPDFPMSEAHRVKVAKNINASDIDFCEYNGNVEIIYSWGDQRGHEFLARAIVPDMTEAAFCESFF